jgi:uncharacterized glyoxalase superfamily protein PhnB
MSDTWKPAGYTSVSPYLIVDGASRSIEFLTRAFDAREIQRISDDRGKIRHAEVRLGDSVVMIADGAEGWPPVAAHVHLYCADVDAAHRRALEAGAQSVQEPAQRGDADKRGGVKDAGGTTWWIATRMG